MFSVKTENSDLLSNFEPNIGTLLLKHPELRIEQDDYNINVTANYGANLDANEVIEKYTRHNGAELPAHLYFHIPLCSYICHFCNYVKQMIPQNGKRDETLSLWTNLLIDESERYLAFIPWIKQARIESFYIGGGTGALLENDQLRSIIEHIRKNYNLTSDCEMNLEGNPDNFYGDRIRELKEIGFNRFSVGIQSLQDEVNDFTSRGHDRETSIEAILKLKESKCPFNVDIMFGLPFQTPESVTKDIEKLIELEVPTITIYRLRNADRHKMGIGNRAVWNTPKIRERLHNQGVFPKLEETYRMREVLVEQLLKYNYYPSPCGWWSAPNTYPNGNIPQVSKNKWQLYNTMIAYGPGAYGWLTGNNSEIIQTHNESNISKYVEIMKSSQMLPLAFGRHLQGNQAIASALGFAFKANQPIKIAEFYQKFNVDIVADSPYKQVIEELVDKGLLKYVNDNTALKPTLDGEALHEEIISTYLHGKIGEFEQIVCQKFS